jgi:hypothetical protein
MRNIFFIIFLLILIVTGCKKKKKIPDDILRPAKMEKVLLDLMKADEFLGTYVFAADSTLDKKEESIRYYKRILQLHGIRKEQFQKSFSYYKNNADQLKIIADSLVTYLSKITEEENRTKPIMTTDSFIKRYKPPVPSGN